MAKPSTRQGLIDYCKRQLGAPVLEINVDDDQIDDLVDDAIQYFQERHYDGVERMYLKYKFTQSDIDRGKATNNATSTNSAGIVIDAIRLARIALDRKIGGPIKPASAYLMKHPIEQTSDVDAKIACEKFVAGD